MFFSDSMFLINFKKGVIFLFDFSCARLSCTSFIFNILNSHLKWLFYTFWLNLISLTLHKSSIAFTSFSISAPSSSTSIPLYNYSIFIFLILYFTLFSIIVSKLLFIRSIILRVSLIIFSISILHDSFDDDSLNS